VEGIVESDGLDNGRERIRGNLVMMAEREKINQDGWFR
jgi:hypothetical protein